MSISGLEELRIVRPWRSVLLHSMLVKMRTHPRLWRRTGQSRWWVRGAVEAGRFCRILLSWKRRCVVVLYQLTEPLRELAVHDRVGGEGH